MTRETRQNLIPALTDTSPSGLRAWASQVRANISRMLGITAKTDNAALDQVVTYRDLIDAGFAIPVPGANGVPITTPGGSGTTPPAPTGFDVDRLPFNMRLTWNAPTYAGHARTEVWRSTTNNLSAAVKVADVLSTGAIYEDGFNTGAIFYWIRFVSSDDIAGPFNDVGGTSDDTQPQDPTGLSYDFEGNSIRLRWNSVADADLDVYELRVGADWDTGTLIDTTKATSYLWKFQTAGTYKVFLRAKDVLGFYSGTAATVDVVINPPSQVAPTQLIVGPAVRISWPVVFGSFAIDGYEVREGATWAGGTVVSRALTTVFEQTVTWVGVRSYWIAARDIAGNYGTPIQVGVLIVAPGEASALRAEVYDNSVTFYWSAPATGSLPIATYRLYRGATFGAASLIGEKSGLFTVTSEAVAGTYTYWLVAVDTAGNAGTPRSITAFVNQPPDYVLHLDLTLTGADADATSNALIEGADAVLPVDTTETYAAHFTGPGWADPQAQIDAGYPIFIQPTEASGYLEWDYDYGSVVQPTQFVVTPSMLTVAGTPTITYQLSYKLLAGDPWTPAAAGSSGFIPTTFRYVRVRVTIGGAGGDEVVRVASVNIKLSSKRRRDGGRVAVNSGDAGGTTVNFAISPAFSDVTWGPIATPIGTTALYAVVDFADAPNPTSFKILVFNDAGVRQSCDVVWAAEGV